MRHSFPPMNADSTEATRLAAALQSGRIWPGGTEAELLAQAADHGVLPLFADFAHRSRDAGTTPVVREHLRQHVRDAAAASLLERREITRLLADFRESGVEA